MQNILYLQGHSGRVVVHIKLRLKWLISAGSYNNCTTVPETTDCIYLPGLQRGFFFFQNRQEFICILYLNNSWCYLKKSNSISIRAKQPETRSNENYHTLSLHKKICTIQQEAVILLNFSFLSMKCLPTLLPNCSLGECKKL